MGALAAPLLYSAAAPYFLHAIKSLMEPGEAGSPLGMAQYPPFILHCCLVVVLLLMPTSPIPLVIYSLMVGWKCLQQGSGQRHQQSEKRNTERKMKPGKAHPVVGGCQQY